jgi:glycosyltransferase involved in cell wall biosynthesis
MMEHVAEPFFSIIIPMYNVEDRISVAFEGLRAQTCQDFEVHFVDDKSSDGTIEALHALIKKNDRKFVHELPINMGAGPARNRGAEQAKGQYLVFHDADDWLDEEALELLKKHIVANSFPDAIVFQYSVFDINRKVKRRVKRTLEKLPSEMDGQDMFRAICRGEINLATWNKAFKRSNWRKNKLKFHPSHIYEDLAFIPYACLFMERVTICLDARYCYFHNPDGVTFELSDRQANAPFDALNDLQVLLEEVPNYLLLVDDFIRLAFNTFHYRFFYANRKNIFSDQQTLIYLDNIIQFCKLNGLKTIDLLNSNRALDLIEGLLLQLKVRGLRQDLKFELNMETMLELFDHYTVLSRQMDLTLEYSGEEEDLQNKWIAKETLLEKKIGKLKRKNERLKSSFTFWVAQYVTYWFNKILGRNK